MHSPTSSLHLAPSWSTAGRVAYCTVHGTYTVRSTQYTHAVHPPVPAQARLHIGPEWLEWNSPSRANRKKRAGPHEIF